MGNVLAGMEAAFIDVGLPKSGFLHVDEVVAMGVPKHKRQIADLIKKGDEVLVQATKDPMGTKGCRLTMQLSLAGRFVVYVPYGDGVGVSRKLLDDERKRLRKICGALPLQGGLIVRTAAAGASAEDIARDYQALRRLWEALKARTDQIKAPQLLYSEADVSLKVIRDLLNAHVDEVIVDDPGQHERIVSFLKRTSPAMAARVRLYEGEQPLLTAFGAEKAIRSTLERRAPLPSGGYLIIDDTEAMTVIDVNSGGNVGRGGSRLEETVTKTNLEAAAEVVRQLRLRDIGGIIIIDFIDMSDASNRKAVKAALDAALERDRTRTYVADISPLGLVEMTRQNISDGPREVMTEPCPHCEGFGFVLSDETVAIDSCRAAARVAAGESGDHITVRVSPRAAELLNEDGRARVLEVEELVGKQVTVEPDRGLADGEAKAKGRRAA